MNLKVGTKVWWIPLDVASDFVPDGNYGPGTIIETDPEYKVQWYDGSVTTVPERHLKQADT